MTHARFVLDFYCSQAEDRIRRMVAAYPKVADQARKKAGRETDRHFADVCDTYDRMMRLSSALEKVFTATYGKAL